MSGGREYPWMLRSKHSLHLIFASYLDFHLNWNYYVAGKNRTVLVARAKLSFKCVLMISILIDSMFHESAGAAWPILVEEDLEEVTVQKIL